MTKPHQIKLFERDGSSQITRFGQSSVTFKQAKSILTPTSGFLDTYDYSLNPYSGCAFACNYCYAAFFNWDKSKQDNWGYWVEVKENALAVLQKKRKRPLINKTIYLSSVTDPYQPIEKKLALTRSLLKELEQYHQVNLVIQTRSPLVVRDIDILQKMPNVQVNMTVTTDSNKVRKVFEPSCPSHKQRLKAIKKVKEVGIGSCITMTPLLPVEDAHAFGKLIAETAVDHTIVQYFHATKGKFVAGTRNEALSLINQMGWTPEKYEEVKSILKQYLPNLTEGKDGFAQK